VSVLPVPLAPSLAMNAACPARSSSVIVMSCTRVAPSAAPIDGVESPSSTVSSPSMVASSMTCTSTVWIAPSALPIGKVTVCAEKSRVVRARGGRTRVQVGDERADGRAERDAGRELELERDRARTRGLARGRARGRGEDDLRRVDVGDRGRERRRAGEPAAARILQVHAHGLAAAFDREVVERIEREGLRVTLGRADRNVIVCGAKAA